MGHVPRAPLPRRAGAAGQPPLPARLRAGAPELHAEDAAHAEPRRLRPARLGPRERTTRERAFSYYSQSLPVFDRNLKNLAREDPRRLPARARARRRLPHAGRDLAAELHPFQFPDVPLVLAHNGDLARFAEMKPLLARAHQAARSPRRSTAPPTANGSTRSCVSQLADPHGHPAPTSSSTAIRSAPRDHPRRAREARHRRCRSSLNLFIADGTPARRGALLLRLRLLPHRGCRARVHEANLSYLSLWYTARPRLRPARRRVEDDRRRRATPTPSSSRPSRSRAISPSWVEVPEYAMLHAEIRGGRSRSVTCSTCRLGGGDELAAW